MLIGEYRHTIDVKKRLALPAKFRKEIGKKVVVTYGLDNCLFVYPLKEWEKAAQGLANLSLGQASTRDFNRFMLGGAVETDVDAMGRILLPDFQREFAGLSTKVVIAGLHSRLEIWDENRWKDYTGRVKKQADMLAEKLGEIGAL
ncbi:MAG: cell division/cell wall cluster transcriptional repressor MraZ [Candidatus Vogelbacteria bacterium RIFOXYD1_FULL_46_19]|uniref:Transcriptional regulator MraZ n=1 Tax=Candidatus Vogelbacteria bacterium RIFOXYD1_FULL_46_19 TaxID=1802439 RepID=A0A1G2QFV2_9BACT|nr:MAG: cell division/cell wall cluster transcriptional repressor MraZ [Candidatus Vogelbacteria bacterium RIFOXYD1_FULL_46_19]